MGEDSTSIFVGHIVPSLALILFGLWHTINTIKVFYNKGSSNFTVKMKHLKLIFIQFFLVFSIFMHILDFHFFCFSFKLNSFEHTSMVGGIFVAFVFFQELFLLHFHSTNHVGLKGHYH
uniref:Uncharacterized protein n=1 Tax=Populus trichocarpa TaxID=3694 RepID=U5GLQ3_POPTR